MSRQTRYPSDLTDEEWTILEPLLERPRRDGRGRPRTVDRREVVNAILYVLRTGCQWRYLPEGFPKRNTLRRVRPYLAAMAFTRIPLANSRAISASRRRTHAPRNCAGVSSRHRLSGQLKQLG